MNIIESNAPQLRDSFILVEKNRYYMYGSGWECYRSDGDLRKWSKLEKQLVITPDDFVENRWAPEVHRYQGAYYMFTTYRSDLTQRRGCKIFCAESAEGPFREISKGTITPAQHSCIDGTLYVDEEQQPWMVFVHEWVCTEDRIGRMAAAKLSPDFTHFISEPIELFRADEPTWANNALQITDGPFLYRTQNGKLLMLWSNFCEQGYCVAIAESENGRIDGKWKHQPQLLYSRQQPGDYDGGHGMIFRALDGQLYLSMHSPNAACEERNEKPVFIPVMETDDGIELVR